MTEEKHLRYLFASLGLVCLSINAAPISDITITGIPSGGSLVQWNTPINGPLVSDVWRVLAGPTYGAYFNNQLNVNAGDSGTLNLRLEGFGGFATLASIGGINGYRIDVTRGVDTLSLTCDVQGASCTSAGSSSMNGFAISQLQMTEDEVNVVGSFADQIAPGSGTNLTDIAVSFNYAADVTAVPEPATALLLAAGLLSLGLFRRR